MRNALGTFDAAAALKSSAAAFFHLKLFLSNGKNPLAGMLV